MSRYDLGGRDLNEPEFIEFLKRAGIHYRQLDKKVGADLLILTVPVELWEVKNPEQPPNKRRLSDNEEKTKALCESLGIPYFVFEHVEQAVDHINSIRERIG